MASNPPAAKRPLSTLGLALVAALALGVATAASASASTPQFEPEGSSWPISVNGKGGAIALKTKAGRTVACSASSMGVEWNNFTQWRAYPKFTGCTYHWPFGSLKCTSPGASGGEIVAVPMWGNLRYIVVNGQQKAGMYFAPQSGELIAEFTCATGGVTEKIKIKGSIVAEITPTNEFTSTFTLTFRQSEGVQNPTGYLADKGCSAVEAAPTTSGEGWESFASEQSALEGTETMTASEALKLVAGKCL